MSDDVTANPDHKAICQASEDLKMFAGGAVLLVIFALASYFIAEFRPVVVVQFGALIGGALMKMKGNG